MTNQKISETDAAVLSHYRRLMDIPLPWEVSSVNMDKQQREVVVVLSYPSGQQVSCPECGTLCPTYDHRKRRWRHLSQMSFRTIIECDVPRCNCTNHGKHVIEVPWAEPKGKFTLEYEAFAILVLQKCASLREASEILGVSWDTVHNLLERAVSRGLKRRKQAPIKNIGLDEKSFLSKHRYATVMTDIDNKRVLDVSQGRDIEATYDVLCTLTLDQRQGVEAVAADFWESYAIASSELLPYATLVHDKFHVSSYLTKAVDAVRKKEHKELLQQGRTDLKGTKYVWLTNAYNWSKEYRNTFRTLQASSLKVGRAYSLKENFRHFWDYVYEGSAKKFFDKWYSWAIRSRLEPMKKVARTLKRHEHGLLAYTKRRITNAYNESANAIIQKLKSNARGFRNFENFRTAILFKCGALEMNPHKSL